MTVVQPRPAFEREVIERLAWLAQNGTAAWVDNFLAALDQVERDLYQFPESSPIVRQDNRVVVRQRRLRRDQLELPYFIYYTHLREAPVREVFLSHLFHERQRRPRLKLSKWPW